MGTPEPSTVSSDGDLDDAEVVVGALAGQAGAFDDVARGLLLADPEVDLAGGAAVVHAGGDGLALRERVGEVVLPGEQAAVRHLVGGAGLVAGDVRVVGEDHVPLAAEVNACLPARGRRRRRWRWRCRRIPRRSGRCGRWCRRRCRWPGRSRRRRWPPPGRPSRAG